MKNLIILSISLITLLSCKNTKRDISKQFPLLERKESLRQGKEWENSHNMYTRLAEAVRKNPHAPKPYIEMAELFMMEARVTGEHGYYYSNGLKLIALAEQNMMNDKDQKFRALSDKASIQLSLHQFANAKVTAEEAVKINPYNAQIYGALVDAHVELGDYKTAVAMADKMVSIRPDLRSYSRISYLRELYGDMPGAIDAMKQAVEAGMPGYEETAWTRLQLGNLYKKNHDIMNASMQYNMILQERKDYPFAIAALADLEKSKNNLVTADSLIDLAIQDIPEVAFYITKAEIKKQQGKKDEAKRLSDEVIHMLNDDQASGHKMDLTYAHVYKDLFNDLDKSMEYAMKEYSIRPNNAEVNKFISDLYITMGKNDLAMKYVEKSKVTKI